MIEMMSMIFYEQNFIATMRILLRRTDPELGLCAAWGTLVLLKALLCKSCTALHIT